MCSVLAGWGLSHLVTMTMCTSLLTPLTPVAEQSGTTARSSCCIGPVQGLLRLQRVAQLPVHGDGGAELTFWVLKLTLKTSLERV